MTQARTVLGPPAVPAVPAVPRPCFPRSDPDFDWYGLKNRPVPKPYQNPQAVPAVPKPYHPKTASDQPKHVFGTAGTAGTAPLPTCSTITHPMHDMEAGR